jgi:hypothetical protein
VQETPLTKHLTSASLEIPPRILATPIEPETIRLPKSGDHDPYFGLTRSAINAVVLPTEANGFKPPVKSFVLRKKGARTGIRLISFSSLRDYIHRHEEGQTQ